MLVSCSRLHHLIASAHLPLQHRRSGSSSGDRQRGWHERPRLQHWQRRHAIRAGHRCAHPCKHSPMMLSCLLH